MLQVNLSWGASTDNVGVTGYTISRTDWDGGNPVTLATVGSGTLSYTDVPPSQGTNYIYSVTAHDAAGNVSGAATTQIALPDFWRSVQRADFNGDGKSDVVVLGKPADGSDLQVFLANSTGTGFLAPSQWWHGVGWNWNNIRILAGDVNGDGKADIVINGRPDMSSSDFQVLTSTGSSFNTPQQWWSYTGWSWTSSKPMIGDVNGDGKADMVIMGIPAVGSSDLQVFLSTGTSFQANQQWWSYTGWNWYNSKPMLGDFDGDGKADVVIHGTPSAGSSDFQFLRSTGTSFATNQQWWNGPNWVWDNMKDIVGDFNGDGKADIAALGRPDGSSSDMQVWLTNSTGTGFLAPSQWWHYTGWSWLNSKPIAGDFDGNGKTDFAILGISGTNSSDLQVFTSTGSAFNANSQWWNGPGWAWNNMKVQ